MNQDLSTAFVVLAVGMATVFVILGLVVLTGNLLIKFVNRFYPVAVQQPQRPTIPPLITKPAKTIQTSQMAAIVAAVDMVSGGKARIKKIEKINPDQ
ncbi:MAG: OadG family protein [Bacteroidota bacterium]